MLAGDTFAQITGLVKCFDPKSARKRKKERQTEREKATWNAYLIDHRRTTTRKENTTAKKCLHFSIVRS